uniref:Uncharacterized protein n=1 Tax=Sphaerodactylus townsendi TaxID=933632 RepID=A0ACB8FGY3_9SAUR
MKKGHPPKIKKKLWPKIPMWQLLCTGVTPMLNLSLGGKYLQDWLLRDFRKICNNQLSPTVKAFNNTCRIFFLPGKSRLGLYDCISLAFLSSHCRDFPLQTALPCMEDQCFPGAFEHAEILSAEEVSAAVEKRLKEL